MHTGHLPNTVPMGPSPLTHTTGPLTHAPSTLQTLVKPTLVSPFRPHETAQHAAGYHHPSPVLATSTRSRPPIGSAALGAAQIRGPPPPSHAAGLAGTTMKLRVACRKIYNYVRTDLKEIAFPSSLPDPPHIKKRRTLTWTERWLVLKEASRLYAASWVRDIGPDLHPSEYKKDAESGGKASAEAAKDPSMMEDLAVAARGGMETLKPALQRVYMMRASAYRDALKSFIQGYQEGIKQVGEEKENLKAQGEDGVQKKST